jgi:hypothetical protein
MMYIHEGELARLKADVAAFLDTALPREEDPPAHRGALSPPGPDLHSFRKRTSPPHRRSTLNPCSPKKSWET